MYRYGSSGSSGSSGSRIWVKDLGLTDLGRIWGLDPWLSSSFRYPLCNGCGLRMARTALGYASPRPPGLASAGAPGPLGRTETGAQAPRAPSRRVHLGKKATARLRRPRQDDEDERRRMARHAVPGAGRPVGDRGADRSSGHQGHGDQAMVRASAAGRDDGDRAGGCGNGRRGYGAHAAGQGSNDGRRAALETARGHREPRSGRALAGDDAGAAPARPCAGPFLGHGACGRPESTGGPGHGGQAPSALRALPPFAWSRRAAAASCDHAAPESGMTSAPPQPAAGAGPAPVRLSDTGVASGSSRWEAQAVEATAPPALRAPPPLAWRRRAAVASLDRSAPESGVTTAPP